MFWVSESICMLSHINMQHIETKSACATILAPGWSSGAAVNQRQVAETDEDEQRAHRLEAGN